MTKVDVTNQPEAAAAYHLMNKRNEAGKGDLGRSNFSQAFREGYDAIDWGLNAHQRMFHRNGTIDGKGRFREGMGDISRDRFGKSPFSKLVPTIE